MQDNFNVIIENVRQCSYVCNENNEQVFMYLIWSYKIEKKSLKECKLSFNNKITETVGSWKC